MAAAYLQVKIGTKERNSDWDWSNSHGMLWKQNGDITLRLLSEKSENDSRYDYKVNFSWEFRTMTDISGDDFYTAF